jgi:transposase
MGYFNKLLGITGFEIQKQKQDGKNIYYHLKQRRKTAVCPNCGKRTNIIHDYRLRRQVKHGTILGKICILIFKPRRFFCFVCHQPFTLNQKATGFTASDAVLPRQTWFYHVRRGSIRGSPLRPCLSNKKI